jgi:hypothetical protein
VLARQSRLRYSCVVSNGPIGDAADVPCLIAEEVDEFLAHMGADISRDSSGVDRHDDSLSSRQSRLSRGVVELARRRNNDCRMAGTVCGDATMPLML